MRRHKMIRKQDMTPYRVQKETPTRDQHFPFPRIQQELQRKLPKSFPGKKTNKPTNKQTPINLESYIQSK